MTLYITPSTTTFNVAFNSPNLVGDHTLVLVSQWSNTTTVSFALTQIEANDRYSEFTATAPVGFTDEHVNGIYTYQLLYGTNVVEEGLCKLITNPGGTDEFNEYVSDNENREAETYYRPDF
jgi:hypothetical protein